jgi:glycosyltransferase involved in cell wall biosynthesis
MQWRCFTLPLRTIWCLQPRLLHDRLVAWAIQRNPDAVDIVHCWPGASLHTLTAARKLGIPTFLERPNCHTRFAFERVREEHHRLGVPMPRGYYSHAFDKRRLAREEAEFRAARWLLCPSDFVLASFLSEGFSRNCLLRHRYGYDPSRFGLVSQCADRVADDAPIEIAFIGRCEPRKGLHYALKAWLSSDASKTGKFHVCGEFLPGYREVLTDMLAHDSVVSHGRVKDPAEILCRCHALVLSSVEEGSALVTYEAQSCGCALLVSKAAGAVCEHMVGGLVHEVGDVVTLGRHMGLLCNDRLLLGRLRSANLAASGELTWESAGRVLYGLYKQHIGMC